MALALIDLSQVAWLAAFYGDWLGREARWFALLVFMGFAASRGAGLLRARRAELAAALAEGSAIALALAPGVPGAGGAS